MRLTSLILLPLAACTGAADGQPVAATGADAGAQTASLQSTKHTAEEPLPFTTRIAATFAEPWAIAWLPDGRALVTEKGGTLKLWSADGPVRPVAGVPAVDYGGQGGLGDVALAADFATTGHLYLSFVEAGPNDTHGAVVIGATLTDWGGTLSLTDRHRVWEQVPKVAGRGHFSHRIAVAPDGRHLWITSGERQKGAPAQDLSNNLGSTLRLMPDGSVPADNPFADRGGPGAQVWSYGHRNLLGIAFDGDGVLWTSEMGPKGGDEINREARGANYGWPEVSNGDDYDGTPIPDHATRPEFTAPATWWNPSISPAGLMFVRGDRYPGWKGNALLPALSGKALVRVAFDAGTVREVARYPMGRIRAVAERGDGTIWLLEDGDAGRLVELVPR